MVKPGRRSGVGTIAELAGCNASRLLGVGMGCRGPGARCHRLQESRAEAAARRHARIQSLVGVKPKHHYSENHMCFKLWKSARREPYDVMWVHGGRGVAGCQQLHPCPPHRKILSNPAKRWYSTHSRMSLLPSRARRQEDR